MPERGSRPPVDEAALNRMLATSPPTDELTSSRMSRQRSRDTSPEILLRQSLRRKGLTGYRINRRLPNIPRRTCDVAFVGLRVAVFVDGCFWHSCPMHGVSPKNNAAWWEGKLGRNVRRDRDTERRLEAQGWTVLRFWEHEDMELAADVVEGVLRTRPDRVR